MNSSVLSSKATLTLAFLTILVAAMVLFVSFSSMYAVLNAIALGDELSIPSTGAFLLAAVTLFALMSVAVSVIKIVVITRRGIKKRKKTPPSLPKGRS